MPSRPTRSLLAALCLPLLLASCGGGGGDGSDDGPPSQQSGPDPLLSSQWHLANTGQSGGTPGQDLRAIATWQTTRGEGARVAVIDDAIEIDHEDLAPNVADYFNYRRPGSPPAPETSNDDHGTPVAGIAVARDDNAVGGAGVAPRASLGAYNALATGATADIADALNRDFGTTDVYHNSWGSPDDGTLHAADSSFVAAIQRGIREGRGGRGAIYVFPAGNGGPSDNANFDGYVNKLGIITACAVDHDGKAPNYAEAGANILVCGPSGNGSAAITTTAVGNGYTSSFSGTSASAPMVSGVAALVLAARPELSWRDVRLILAHSARQTDPAHPRWVAGTDGRPAHNPNYGFGAVDAEAAVALARNWTSVGGSESLLECSVGSGPVTIPIPDAPASGAPTTVPSTLTVAGCPITRIEFVEIRFTASHGYAGDLRIDLVSPRGLVSRLAENRLCDRNGDRQADSCGTYDDWPFGSVRHLDEPADGTWTLEVTDRQLRDDGRLTGWSLRFWGR